MSDSPEPVVADELTVGDEVDVDAGELDRMAQEIHDDGSAETPDVG